MDVSCLQHRLTDEQRQHFEEHGWLQIENALSKEQIETLTAKTDAIHDGLPPETSPVLKLGIVVFVG